MTEDFAKLLPELNLLEGGPHDPETVWTVAEFKRLADLWRLDADFREAYRLDPEKAVAETGLNIDPEAFLLYLRPEEAEKMAREIREGRIGPEALPESFLMYQAVLRERMQVSQRIRETSRAPEEPRFRAWLARQDRRSRLLLGPRMTENMMPLPLAFELSDGCSVGCPFCAFAAEGLRGLFRYTGEHAALWRETLRRLHALIGDAAGYGICYYATEPLDNPDYEKFIADYEREFGVLPMTTTAVATRDIERTRKLLKLNDEKGDFFNRVSVLSPAMRDTLFTAFTPEELLKVLLLPQFPEAPGNVFTKAGRGRDPDREDAVGGTIACATGFIVNMQEMTVRLETPYVSDHSHPTGEWILEKCAFTSAEDLEAQIRRMIAKYMPESLELGKHCEASCDFRLLERDGAVWGQIRKREFVVLQSPIRQAALDSMVHALREGRHTGGDILDQLPEDTDSMAGFLLLNLLWHHGLIDQNPS